LDFNQQYLSSHGFGNPLVKQSISSSSGYCSMIDSIQEICLGGRKWFCNHIIVPLWNVTGKKTSGTFFGPAPLQKNVGTLSAPCDKETFL
jgi:hypothetical protein